jgi:competence protein ComEC
MSPEATTPDANVAIDHRQPVVVLLAAVVLGILFDRFVGAISAAPLIAVGLATLIVWHMLWVRRRERFAVVPLLLALACCGAAWHQFCWRLYPANEIGVAASDQRQPVCLQAVAVTHPRVVSAPRRDRMRAIPKGEETRIEIRVTGVRDRETWRPVSGRATLLVAGHLPGVKTGDRLFVFAHMQRPSAARNPGEFDYAAFARKSGKLCVLRTGFPDCVETVESGSSLNVWRLFQDVRHRATNTLWRYLGAHRGGLASAVLLGAREQLEAERTEAFFETGAIHFMAVSGLHAGILAWFCYLLGRVSLLSRRQCLLLATVVVLVYALLTESRPPVVRTAVLVSLFCVGWLIGRRTLTANSLAVAALIVLASNPCLLFEVGTQLSFLAVATLGVVGPWLLRSRPVDPLRQLISSTRAWPVRATKNVGRWFWRLTLASAALWLVALPLVLYHFHIASPIAIILTPLLWVPVAAALLSGFGVLALALLFPPAAHVCAALCNGFLYLIETSVQFGRAVPGGHFWLPGPSLWWVLGFYAILAAILVAPRRWRWRRWTPASAAGWVIVGVAAAYLPAASRSVADGRADCHCTFIAVGHGSSVLLETEDGKTMLYDCGCLTSPETASQSISAVLWSKGITHIDAVVLSHADIDHYNGLPGLLDRFSIGMVCVSPTMFDRPTPALTELKNAITAAGTPLKTVYAGDRFEFMDGVSARILHPPKKGVLGNDNANSVVLRVDIAGHRLLLPGDLESPGLDDVLAEEPIDCDVVMAPHHGSLNSNPGGFVQWCTPEKIVISGGRSVNLDKVKLAFEGIGAEVVHTAESGAVTVSFSQTGVALSTHR